MGSQLSFELIPAYADEHGNGQFLVPLLKRNPSGVRWVTREKGTFGFVRGDVLSMRLSGESPDETLRSAKNLLNRLSTGGNI